MAQEYKEQTKIGKFIAKLREQKGITQKELADILKTGDWLYIPAGEPHQHISESACRLFIIKISANIKKL